MIQTSSQYKALFSNPQALHEYRITIGDREYYNDKIAAGSMSLSQQLFKSDNFTVGSFVSSLFKVNLYAKRSEISRNADITFSLRYVLGDESSEWITKFTGKVYQLTNIYNSLQSQTDAIAIEAYDASINDDIFLDVFSTDVSSYPANTRTVANLVSQKWSLPIVNPEDIINGDFVEYPNDLTVREVMQYIAMMSGGNWYITGDGQLKLLILKGENVVGKYAIQNKEKYDILPRITKVIMYYDDDKAFSAGTDRGQILELDCPWATQDVVNHVLARVSNYWYIGGFTKGAYLDPAIELGDGFSVGEIKIDNFYAGTTYAQGRITLSG